MRLMASLLVPSGLMEETAPEPKPLGGGDVYSFMHQGPEGFRYASVENIK